jgi:hypothetical protein
MSIECEMCAQRVKGFVVHISLYDCTWYVDCGYWNLARHYKAHILICVECAKEVSIGWPIGEILPVVQVQEQESPNHSPST